MARTNLRHGTTNVSIQDENLLPIDLVRLSRLGRELRLTDQILSDDLDTLSIVKGGPAPAWTTLEGDHISFDLDKMPLPKGSDDVAVWLGTNAHELGHVLFSPRRHTPLMQRVIAADKYTQQGMAQLHNILEDQRQERLILGRFAPWRAFLIAALGHHLVTGDDSAWLLLCGRTWLPEAIRRQARARFEVAYNSTIADEVVDIVGSYQKLIDPGFTEFDEAWELLDRLYNLLPHMPHLPSRVCTVMSGGEPDTDPSVGGETPPTADEAEGEGAGGDDGSGNGQAEEDDTSDEGASDGQQSGGGIGEGGEPPIASKDMQRSLTKAAQQELEESQESKQELDKILGTLQHGRGTGGDVDGELPEGRYIEASDGARLLRHEVSEALLDLKDASEPGWVKRTDAGRINVRRFVNPNIDADEWFDRYEPGQMDASELEVFLLLDVSGSMMGRTFALSEATWAIRHAVDDLEGSCTVFTFCSGQHRVLSTPTDRPDNRMFLLSDWGGTDPGTALTATLNTLGDSRARNRLMVVLTDGGWWESGSNNSNGNIIQAMNEVGIITVIAQLGAGAGTETHGCRYAGSIDDPSGLARLFRKVATEQIGQWL